MDNHAGNESDAGKIILQRLVIQQTVLAALVAMVVADVEEHELPAVMRRLCSGPVALESPSSFVNQIKLAVTAYREDLPSWDDLAA